MVRSHSSPLSQVARNSFPDPVGVLHKCLDILVRLAEHGLIHCDYNEFNLMVDKKGQVTLIDFPQMISTSHENCGFYFDRDVQVGSRGGAGRGRVG